MNLTEIVNSINNSSNPEQQARLLLNRYPEILPHIAQHLPDHRQLALEILTRKPDLTSSFFKLISFDEARTFANVHIQNYTAELTEYRPFIFYLENNLVKLENLKYWAKLYSEKYIFLVTTIQKLIDLKLITVEDIQDTAKLHALKQASYIRIKIKTETSDFVKSLILTNLNAYEIIKIDWNNRDEKKLHADVLKLYITIISTEELADLALQEIQQHNLSETAIQEYRNHLPEVNEYVKVAQIEKYKNEIQAQIKVIAWTALITFFFFNIGWTAEDPRSSVPYIFNYKIEMPSFEFKSLYPPVGHPLFLPIIALHAIVRLVAFAIGFLFLISKVIGTILALTTAYLIFELIKTIKQYRKIR